MRAVITEVIRDVKDGGAPSGAPLPASDGPKSPTILGHPLSDGPLPDGQLFDAGTRSYGEFACSRTTFDWLSSGAMKRVNGRAVALQLMEECVGGHNVLVKAWAEDD